MAGMQPTAPSTTETPVMPELGESSVGGILAEEACPPVFGSSASTQDVKYGRTRL